MKDLFRQLSLCRKLLISFTALPCIPALLAGIAAYCLYINFIINMTRKSSIEIIDLICNDIDGLLNDVWNLYDMLTDDIKTQKYLYMDFGFVRDQYSNDLTGGMGLASTPTYCKDIFGIYVLGQNSGRYRSNHYSFKSEDRRETTRYKAIVGSKKTAWSPSHEGSPIVHSPVSDNFITVGQPATDKTSDMVNGIMAVDIKEGIITQKIKYSLGNGVICIIDQEGSILFRPNAGNNPYYPTDISPSLVSHILESTGTIMGEPTVVSDNRYLVASRVLVNPNWGITGIIDRGSLTQSSRNITYIIMLVLLIIAFSSLYVAMFISQSIHEPIQVFYRMTEEMENGDLSIRYTYYSSDELGRLGKNFNQMLERIQRLISRIYEGQKKLKNSELKIPQTQIQFRFLYNSLDPVTWLLRMNKNRDVEKILNELSTLSKILFSKENETIIVEEELCHINSCLFIINMIYNKEFEYAIEYDPVLYSYRTLKPLLQPLAENTIAHTTPMPEQKVSIQTCIYEDEDSLILSVQDISRGVNQETLGKLQQQLGATIHPDHRDSGYGLHSVNERIHVLFGSSYGPALASEPDFGTEVTIKIPRLKGGDISVPGSTS